MLKNVSLRDNQPGTKIVINFSIEVLTMLREFQYIKPYRNVWDINLIWYLSHLQAEKAQSSLCQCTASPELSLLVVNKKENLEIRYLSQFKATKALSSLCPSSLCQCTCSLACDFAARIKWEKKMEICYFSNFKAKSNLRKCTDSPEPSLIAERRNNMEIMGVIS